MAKKSALNLLISKTCVALVNGMSGWKQTSRTRLANFLASVTWYVLARRRKIALTNLRLCFPEWSEQKRVETAKGVFRNLIRAALDHSVLAKGTEAQVLEMVKFEGKEQFEELCKTDKVIIVAPHFVGLDAGGIAMNTICGEPLCIRPSQILFGINGLLTHENASLIPFSFRNPTRP